MSNPKPDNIQAKLLSALRLAKKSDSPKPKTSRLWPWQRVAPAVTDETPSQPKVRPVVFGVSAALIVAIAAWATYDPESSAAILGAMVTWVSNHFGWFYIVTGTIVVGFMLYIAVGRSGRIRLGPDHSRPQYSLYSWVAMLFAAGIGVDLLFFSVAEPVYQYYNPPVGSPETVEAARQAVVLTLFHYGITGWAMYAMMGMAFGYFAYRFNMPLTIRSALYPIFGKRVKGAIGDAVDIAAQLGTIFGVATSLGIGVVQLNYGLNLLFGIPEGYAAQAALIFVAVAMATLSAVSGVDKGIKRLSQVNVGLAIVLLVYILFTGRTSFLLDSMVMNIGQYFATFPSLTLDTYAFTPNAHEWLNSWTIFFWAWWVAWAPFVGLFLARISRGRTLRQFVTGTLLLPFSFIVLWVSIFGNSALDRVVNDKDVAFGHLAAEAPEKAFYLLLEQYPFAPVVMVVASVVGLLLYVTSADSAALVMSNFTSRITSAAQDGPRWSRIFWAVATGALTIGMLGVGGIPALQMATIVVGLPFAVVIYLIMWGLLRSLRLEAVRGDVVPVATQDRRSWGQWLTYAVSYPSLVEAKQFLTKVATPALTEVAEALVAEGVAASITSDETTVTLTANANFIYAVSPVPYAMPSYAMRVDPIADRYFQVEVFVAGESLGYDIMGYEPSQVFADVMDHWNDYQDRARQGAWHDPSEFDEKSLDWDQEL